MTAWEDKTFRVLLPIKGAFEALMARKGEQMYAISAAMLWYVHATPETRLEHEGRVRRIEQGVGTVDDPGMSEQDHAALLKAVYELNARLAEGWPRAETPGEGGATTAADAIDTIAAAERRVRQQEREETGRKKRRKKAK